MHVGCHGMSTYVDMSSGGLMRSLRGHWRLVLVCALVGLALAGAGLLSITIRDGVIVSFVSNFADNFSQAQKAVGKPGERPPVNVGRPSLTAAAGAQPPAPAQRVQPAQHPPGLGTLGDLAGQR